MKSQQTQQEFLRSAKEVLAVSWDELARRAGIAPRALKTYRMPLTSQDFRPLPEVAQVAITLLVANSRKN